MSGAVLVAGLLAAAVLAGAGPAPAQPASSTTTAVPAADAGTPTVTTIPSSSGAPQQAKAGPGDILVTQLREGTISVVTTGEVSKTVVSGLTTPTGIASLDDGSILVAENQANRISGVGGRFPGQLTKLADVTDPYALGTSPDGAVYVTQLVEGKVGQLDLNSSQLTPVAEGLSRPTAVVGFGGDVYVTEAGAGKVTKIAKDGTTSDFATNVGNPTGLAFGPDAMLYVSDFVGNRILKIDPSGNATEFASVPGPTQLGIDPVEPKATDPFQIVAAVQSGIVQYRPDASIVAKVDYGENSAVGLAIVPGGPPPSPEPVVPAGTTPTIVTTTVKAAAPTRGAQVAQPEPSGGNGAVALVVLLLALALIVAVGIAGATYARRGRRTEQEAGFTDLHESAVTMTQAMGPCAAEEVELAEAEDTLRQVTGQRLGAEARLNDANARVVSAERRVTESRQRAEALLRQRKAVQADEPDRDEPDDGGPPKLSLAELGLTTEAGRAALQAFGRGELTAVELRERWEELGEHNAVSAVQGQSEKIARTTPWPEERHATLAADQAQLELEQAQRDGRDAKADIERLGERERALNDRIAVARSNVDACHKRQRLVDEEAASAAASALADLQIAADLAAASGKPKVPLTAEATSPDSASPPPPPPQQLPPVAPPPPTPHPPPHVGRPKRPPEDATAADKASTAQPGAPAQAGSVVVPPAPLAPNAPKAEAEDTGQIPHPVVPPDQPSLPEPSRPDAAAPAAGGAGKANSDQQTDAAPAAAAEDVPKPKGRGLFRRGKANDPKDPFAVARAEQEDETSRPLPPPPRSAEPAEPPSPAGPPPTVKELLDQRRSDQSSSLVEPDDEPSGSGSGSPPS